MTVGCKGIEVEGDQRCARRLCTPHTLDDGMETRNRRAVAGYETDRLGTRARRRDTRAQRAGSGPIMDANILSPLALEREDNILVLHIFGPAKRRKLPWRPSLDEAQQGKQAGIVGIGEFVQVPFSKRCQARDCVLAFRSGHSECEGGVVPKKERTRRYARSLE